jgi:type I restriction enzyme S subunit
MEYVALKEVCRINMGQSPESSSYNENGDGIPFFQGNADFGERYPVTRVWCNAPTKVAYAGDILISVRAPIGALNYAKEECCIGRGLAAITPDLSRVSSAFVYWLLKGKNVELNSKGTGSTFKAIGRKVLEETLVPAIDFETQNEYATNLEKVYSVIQMRKQELLKLDELIKARFVELFGDMADPACKWEKCKLVDACVNSDDIKCGPFGTQLGKDEYTTEGVAVWEIPQINSEFKTSPTHFVTEKKAAELDSYSIIPGDIAMSRKGNVGRCAVFPLSFENGIIHSDVLRIRLDATKAFPEFMMRQLHYSGDIQHQIELVSSGAIMAGINVTKLKQIFVYLPPVDLQGEFVTFVAQVDKSKSVIQKSLDETQLLFDKLMQDYFG